MPMLEMMRVVWIQVCVVVVLLIVMIVNHSEHVMYLVSISLSLVWQQPASWTATIAVAGVTPVTERAAWLMMLRGCSYYVVKHS